MPKIIARAYFAAKSNAMSFGSFDYHGIVGLDGLSGPCGPISMECHGPIFMTVPKVDKSLPVVGAEPPMAIAS